VVAPGERFCRQCGAEVGASAGGGAENKRPPWWIAVAAAVVVILILLIPQRAERAGPLPARQPLTEQGPPGGMGAPGGMGGGFTGDIRQDADRLFNRVMGAAEAGEMDEVNQFMPMALQAYEMVPELDHDGLFHLAILYETAGEYEMARARAEDILRSAPDHILALGVAGTASVSAGDSAAAGDYFQRLLDGFEQESQRLRPEYGHHQVMVDEYRRIARSYVQQG
jgi:tetratricopeptide (TPR) repeat protein